MKDPRPYYDRLVIRYHSGWRGVAFRLAGGWKTYLEDALNNRVVSPSATAIKTIGQGVVRHTVCARASAAQHIRRGWQPDVHSLYGTHICKAKAQVTAFHGLSPGCSCRDAAPVTWNPL